MLSDARLLCVVQANQVLKGFRTVSLLLVSNDLHVSLVHAWEGAWYILSSPWISGNLEISIKSAPLHFARHLLVNNLRVRMCSSVY